jgi:hypothetical protein
MMRSILVVVVGGGGGGVLVVVVVVGVGVAVVVVVVVVLHCGTESTAICQGKEQSGLPWGEMGRNKRLRRKGNDIVELGVKKREIAVGVVEIRQQQRRREIGSRQPEMARIT